MTVEEVKASVAEIKQLDCDPESAHMKEDELRLAVLRCIAGGAENARELAEAAIETAEMNFPRWYA